jgi:lipopolysaccharide transport system permease protein
MRLAATHHSTRFLVSHWRLLWQVSRNELKARYAGSIFGMGWAVLTPLLLLALYAVVYVLVLQVRVPGLSPVQYVLLIFSGLVPFLMTSEALMGGVSAVIANKSVLSNTVFPIDLVPVKAVLLSQIPMVVGFATIIMALLMSGLVSWTIGLLLVIWGLHVLGLIGLVWILSLINLVFRDLQSLMGVSLMGLMIASPIGYTPEMVPASLKVLLILNPLAYFVTAYQDVVILGRLPTWWHWLALAGTSVGVFILGGAFFSRAKRVLIDYV